MQDYLRDLIGVLRYLFHDEPSVMRSIDESYEKTILEQLALIPSNAIKPINDIIEVIKCVLLSIDYDKLSTTISKYDDIVQISINFKALSERAIDRFLFDESRKRRAFVRSIVEELTPVFDCCNRIIRFPSKYTHRLSDLLNPKPTIFDM